MQNGTAENKDEKERVNLEEKQLPKGIFISLNLCFRKQGTAPFVKKKQQNGGILLEVISQYGLLHLIVKIELRIIKDYVLRTELIGLL